MCVEPIPDNPIPIRGVSSLSDDELLRRLAELVGCSRRAEAELVAHVAEVDERRLYAREASPSMFAYCTDVLHLSAPEAYLRISVARAGRVYPVLLAMLRDGRLHLSGIAKLAPYLTAGNVDAVLARAAHRSKRQIEELVAELAAPARPAIVQPTAPARYKVQFTASAAFRDKLERLRALMRHAVPDGDLALILEDAVSEKLRRLEARRVREDGRDPERARGVRHFGFGFAPRAGRSAPGPRPAQTASTGAT